MALQDIEGRLWSYAIPRVFMTLLFILLFFVFSPGVLWGAIIASLWGVEPLNFVLSAWGGVLTLIISCFSFLVVLLLQQIPSLVVGEDKVNSALRYYMGLCLLSSFIFCILFSWWYSLEMLQGLLLDGLVHMKYYISNV